MMITREGRAKLEKELSVKIQEMEDGCVDCIERGDLCPDHWWAAYELILADTSDGGQIWTVEDKPSR